jgi:hypothetical protein
MTFLQRLLPSHDHESLLGDIKEEAPRRSRVWYWSQLVALVLVASWQDVRRHPKEAWAALLTGEVALAVCFAFATGVTRVMWTLQNGGYYLGGYWLTLPHGPLPAPYGGLVAIAINTLAMAFSGWVIARFNRAHGLAMVLPHMILMSLVALAPLASVINDNGPGIRVMTVAAMLWTIGSTYVSIPGGILLGGILGLPPAREHVATPGVKHA